MIKVVSIQLTKETRSLGNPFWRCVSCAFFYTVREISVADQLGNANVLQLSGWIVLLTRYVCTKKYFCPSLWWIIKETQLYKSARLETTRDSCKNKQLTRRRRYAANVRSVERSWNYTQCLKWCAYFSHNTEMDLYHFITTGLYNK